MFKDGGLQARLLEKEFPLSGNFGEEMRFASKTRATLQHCSGEVWYLKRGRRE